MKSGSMFARIGMIVALVAAVLLCLVGFLMCSNNNDDELFFHPNASAVGVWWWHTSANSGIDPANIEFAAKNGVSEIYYATHSFSERHSDFIAAAAARDIKVYLLLGDYKWIEDDSDFHAIMDNFLEYQKSAAADRKFYGVHLDVEPHQNADFADKRAELLDLFLGFVIRTCAAYPDVDFDFDIPFWLTDEVTYNSKTVPLYEAIISEANRVFIMSYRDSADKMYNLGTVPAQIEYARSLDKQIFLSAECAYSSEGNNISYFDKGKAAMYEELNKLKALADYNKLGVSIHHMRAWIELDE